MMSIRVLVHKDDFIKEVSLEEAKRYPQCNVWVSLTSSEREELDMVASYHNLHPLVVEDMTFGRELPKIDEYPDYTFIIIDILDYTGEDIVTHK